MITPENLPLIFTAIVGLLSSFCWPIIVISAILCFRKDIRGLLNRLQTAKLPGGAEASFQFGDLPSDKSVKNAIEKASSDEAKNIVETGKVKWENSGNLYWLGHDLMWTIDAVLRGGDRNAILHGLKQSLHHAHALGLSNTSFDARLSKLYSEAENSLLQDWAPQKRLQFVNELSVIRTEIGDLISSHQSDYGRKPIKS